MNSICIYCGSSAGRKSIYTEAAITLAQLLVARQIRLVYGGSAAGLMGQLANTVINLGGEAIGIIPEPFLEFEKPHPRLTELVITPTLQERKVRMAELSDGFIALPGGVGTLDELFEMWSWAQGGVHNKPCGLLNVAGYYDPLVDFLDKAVAEQFIRPVDRQILLVKDDPETLLHAISTSDPVATFRPAGWLKRPATSSN